MRPAALKPLAVAVLGIVALTGCAPLPEAPQPQPRPADTGVQAPGSRAPAPSARSRALARYYADVQADLRARGLLRTDGGGIDTPYDDRDLIRNFEALTFFDEYAQGAGFRRSGGRPVGLRKWERPVRIAIAFGTSVDAAQRARDRDMVARYAARLSRITGHPIGSDSGAAANFHVLFMGEDDREQTLATVRRIMPDIGQESLDLFRNLPREIHCFVVAFSTRESSHSYDRAIALIRAEHPPLMRRACVHEELAQGLGLANDSPRARPSIFNDDEEFALLTRHDEILLQLLYHPALKPGMMPAEARPILRRLISGPDGALF